MEKLYIVIKTGFKVLYEQKFTIRSERTGLASKIYSVHGGDC